MRVGTEAIACVLALALLCASSDVLAAPRVERFAIVIGNNHSDRRDTRSLRYADDDAVAMHQLLAEAGVHSALYVSLDAESQQLYPELAAAGRPRWTALRAQLARFEDAIVAAERAGAETTLLLFYSGHGDVANGEGYVELEDTHLTRTLLRREILERTSADEVHLVIDACRSYYLAFEKGPGGRRRAAPLVDRGRGRARTGYILSTSSDRESHEWEAFQGGIFSHEVRSALRGAADADRDGSVTYAELGAFLTVANRGIPNQRFRPDFVVRPPGSLTDELLRWRRGGEGQALLLDRPLGHVVLEGPSGERVLDVHPADDQELLLQLPARRPLFLRAADGDREFAIGEGQGPIRISSLSDGRARVASKGALHLAFRQLFSAPFSALDVERYREAALSAGAAVEQRGAALSMQAPEGGGSVVGTAAAGTAIAAGLVGLALGGWAVERSLKADDADQVTREQLNATVADARLGAGISFGVAAGSALVWWLLRDDGEPDGQPARLTVSPSAGSSAAGLAISGSW